MNKAEKSLRWVVNQIPDFKPTTNEEKMLVAIKLYSEAGAEEIKRLEAENAELNSSLTHANEECLKWHERAQNLLKDSGGSISGYEKKISDLQSENATLRKRLEKAVELPCKIGDIVYKVHDRCNGKACPYNGDYGQWRCHYEGKQRCEPFVETIQFCYENIPQIGKTIFISKEEAESRLAELNGEK